MFATASGIKRAQLVVALHFHVLEKLPDRRIRETLRLKLLVGHFAIDQRDRGDVGQTVVGRLARLRFPFFRLAPDDIDRGIVASIRTDCDLRRIADFVRARTAPLRSRSGCDIPPANI